MARKLIYGPDILGFTPSTGILTAKGYIPGQRVLLINNQTINTSIFNFSDPLTTVTTNYDGVTNKTTIDLSVDTSSMSATDKLQIYYETEDVTFEPGAAYVDGVNKFRVSEGQSLIDTDFEYGLQYSKWETLKQVNNIPTTYSLAAATQDPITVSSIDVKRNGTTVTVNCAEPHNLIPGSIVEIIGLVESLYEGTYIVSSVADVDTFTYKVKFKANKWKNLLTPYTLVYPGAFYTGSGVNVLNVETDANPVATGSTITVTTLTDHGFNDGTKLYLKSSRAVKVKKIDSPVNIIAGTATTTQRSTINSSTTPNDSRYFANKPIIIDDWMGDFEINFPFSAVNTTTGQFSYTSNQQVGVARTTPLVTGDAISFYTPVGNTLPGGITSFRTFYVFNASSVTTGITTTNKIGVTTTTFNIASSWGSTTPLVPTSTGNTLYGNHRLIVGRKVNNITRQDVITFSKAHNFKVNDTLVAVSPSAVSAVTRSRSNHTINEYAYYYVRRVNSSTQIEVSTTQGGRIANINSGSSTVTPVASNICVFAKVKAHPYANCLWLPPQVGFATHPYETGDTVTYTASGGVGFVPAGLTNNENYILRRRYPNRFWYDLHPKTTPAINAPINLVFSNAAAGNVYAGIHTISRSTPSLAASTFRISLPPRGGINNNKYLQYSSGITVSAVGGLVNNGYYYAKTGDKETIINPGISTVNDRFRLADVTAETSIYAVAYSKNQAYMDIYVNNTNVVGYGISVGKMIQVSGFDGTAYEQNILNGLHYVTGVTTATSGTYRLKPRVRVFFPIATKNRFNSVSIVGGTKSLKNTRVCGIVSFSSSGGIGTHFLYDNNDNAADGLYEIENCSGTTFTFNTGVEIPTIVKTFTGGTAAGNVGWGTTASSPLINSTWIRVLNHNYADGTQVVYNVGTGNSVIGGLVNGTEYYVRVRDKNHIGLTTIAAEAVDRILDDNDYLIIFNSAGANAAHSLTTNSIKGFLTGPGTVGFSTTSQIITGTKQTRFNSDFSIGDIFRVYTLKPSGNGPGTYFQSRITQIKNNQILQIEEIPEYNSSASNYFVPTRLYPISDSRISHRSYDGGISMTAGLVPNTQVIRQTRRYFKYQSGKGIQCSMAVNFNPTIDIDQITPYGTVGVTTIALIDCKYPHGLADNATDLEDLRIHVMGCEGPYDDDYNQDFPLVEIIDQYSFTVAFSDEVPRREPLGFPKFSIINWGDADVSIKCGMFDSQNGFFFKYNGSKLYCVRRSSTTQLAGWVNVQTLETEVRGVDTSFVEQLAANDRMVIRGQTYKVIRVVDDDQVYIQPGYRAPSQRRIFASKVIDTEVPQEDWSIDPCDGTGRFGYDLDVNKIQMIYMDYSWYGAGKIRYGFKDQTGNLKYIHEFVHNNDFTEAYFRSGNLPVRYEIETLDTPLFSPTLYHWGVSVIMDGGYDEDKGYLFSADSNALPFTNGGYSNNGSGTRPVGSTTSGSKIITAINATEASTLVVGEIVEDNASTTTFPSGTKITAIEIDQTNATTRSSNTYQVTVNKNATSSGSKTFNVYSGTSDLIKNYVPLVSIRLAPSVDNGLTGSLGFRDLINRMQIVLREASILTTHDCEAALYLNSELSDDNFVQVGPPSLSQIYKHEVGDYFTGGTKIYSFRVSGGGIVNTTSGKRGLNISKIDLTDIAVLGNSILGGDRVFPDGPDILTLVAKPIDTSQITGSSPLILSARITWAEQQV